MATGDAGSQRSDVSRQGYTHKKNQEVVVDVGPRPQKMSMSRRVDQQQPSSKRVALATSR